MGRFPVRVEVLVRVDGRRTTVLRVGGELRNAASDASKVMSDLMLDAGRLDELIAMVADGYVHQDRRSLISLPDMDRAAWAEEGVSFQRDSGMELGREREVLAVRGDQLHLSRWTIRYRDGWVREFLTVGHWGGEPLQARRTVMFDPDDVDAAMLEIDRLHAEIEAAES